MTHSVLRYTIMQYNTRYLMFSIYLVEILVVLVVLVALVALVVLIFQPLNIIINNLNIVFYNYITTAPQI